MIEINFLPKELKAQKDAPFSPENLIYLIPLLFAILLLIHFSLGIITIGKIIQVRASSQRWQKLEPQRKAMEGLRSELDLTSADAQKIKELSGQRLNWSLKLNKLSLNLPSGVWFRELSVTTKDFILMASVISLAKDEMALINKFIESLKNDANFFAGFSSLELGPIQRASIGGYDIIDFELIGKFKSNK